MCTQQRQILKEKNARAENIAMGPNIQIVLSGAVSNVSIIFLKRHVSCSQGFYFHFPILHCLDEGKIKKNYQLHHFLNLMPLSKGNSSEAG